MMVDWYDHICCTSIFSDRHSPLCQNVGKAVKAWPNLCVECGTPIVGLRLRCAPCYADYMSKLAMQGVPAFNVANPYAQGTLKLKEGKEEKKETIALPTGICHCDVTAFGMVYKEGCPECPVPEGEKPSLAESVAKDATMRFQRWSAGLAMIFRKKPLNTNDVGILLSSLTVGHHETYYSGKVGAYICTKCKNLIASQQELEDDQHRVIWNHIWAPCQINTKSYTNQYHITP